MKKATLCLLACLLYSLPAIQNASAQLPDGQTIVTLTAEAVGLMDNGEPDEAIRLLEDALELDPDNYACQYEMAYAYYVKQNYTKAIKLLKPLTKHPDCNALLYQLLGNAYDMQGNSNKALKTYEAGLERFPDAGPLYLERGTVLGLQGHLSDAVKSYVTGIKVDPLFASNYYRAAQFYSLTIAPVMGMYFAEIFMILEPDGTRNAEMSRLLFDSYKKHLTMQEDGTLKAQFCDDEFYIATVAIVLNNPTAPTFPFEMLYDKGVIAAVESETQVDLASLNRIRTRFFSFCWKNMADIQKSLETYDYPDLSSFFSFIREVEQAGHLEAYNYWVLREGNWDEFQAWYKQDPQKLTAFAEWFEEHDMKIVDPQELLNGLQAEAEAEAEEKPYTTESGYLRAKREPLRCNI
ncbi:tetratricopeptide repeat protein [uncultured Alistipes sp.]|uniref:tetratricopeptide repeat protein n=1 Tax=uncultured Alistipes sp. TaxID=538949 RepID=UPI002628AD6A|nr:tetratricopeptide repeat protein [uncultured Alistipes sp.]